MKVVRLSAQRTDRLYPLLKIPIFSEKAKQIRTFICVETEKIAIILSTTAMKA
jgi:hypothetical protein